MGFKILNFNIFLGFQENEYFLVYEILWIFLGGHPKIGLVLGVISMYLGSFLKVNIQNRDIFGVPKISNIFLGCLIFLIFFGGKQ